MRNKKLIGNMAVVMTSGMLLFNGCGCANVDMPVSAEPTEAVNEVDTEESSESEESLESAEPTPSPTVEPTEEPVEESSSSEESSESEVDTSEGEEVVQDESESTGIEIVEELDLTMYAQTACNARSGDSTDYDVVTTFSVNEQVHVTGKTVNEWFRVEQSDGEVYVSGKLLGMDKVVVQQQSSGGGSGQQSGGGSDTGSGEQQPTGGSELQVGDVIGWTTNGNPVIYGGEVDTSDFY